MFQKAHEDAASVDFFWVQLFWMHLVMGQLLPGPTSSKLKPSSLVTPKSSEKHFLKHTCKT